MTNLWDLIAQKRYDAALERFQGLGIEAQSTENQMAYGYILCGLKRFDKAAEVYQRLQDVWRGQPQEHIALHQRGMVERERGAYAEALRLYQLERTLIDQSDAPQKAMQYAVNGYELGINQLHLGQFKEAQASLTAALQDALEAGDPMTLGCIYRAWGDYYAATQDAERALDNYGQARLEFLKTGDEMAVQDLQSKVDALKDSP